MSRVALLGIDGCGKSSVLDKLKKDEIYNSYSFLWCRYKPRLLKPLYKIVNKNTPKNPMEADKKELNDNYKKNNSLKKKIFASKIVRALWLKLAFIDYKSTYKKDIKKIKNKNDIIFDRFFYDFFIDQCLNFNYDADTIYKYIKKYEKKFLKLNAVIYLRVTPEVSFARKSDIPNMEYLLKRFNVYERLAQLMNWHIVDATMEFSCEIDKIKKIIGGNE